MRVVTEAAALPSQCVFCPGSARERYIDTEMQFEWYGAFYICELCAVQMGQLLGMITVDQANLLINENSDLSTKVYNLERELAGLKAGLNGLADAGFGNFNLNPDGSLSAHSISTEESLVEPIGESDRGAEAAEESVGDREGTPAESVHDEGLAELRSDDESNGSDFRITI